MTDPVREELDIPFGRIFLDLENPRHEPFETQAQTIEYLCAKENVYQLARDIVRHGLNPLERFAVTKDGDEKGTEEKSAFISSEGNRRVCALKLLNDPDLAPASLRDDFKALAESWDGPETLPCVVFYDQSDLSLWLDRIHGGAQGGVGRKQWTPDQKARHTSDRKNRVALAVLDYAEEHEFITPEQRTGKLTTAQRYLSNPLVRESMGLDTSDLADLTRNRPHEDFDRILKRFANDLVTGEVHSRNNKPEIDQYARELSSIKGLSNERIAPVPLDDNTDTSSAGGATRPKKPKLQRRIPYHHEIHEKLEELDSTKLQHLYHSICAVSAHDHPLLIAVGAWSFFESLSALAGRTSGTDFVSFFSKERLRRYGLGDGKKTSTLREALTRISQGGNTTKHHDTAALFNGQQLANDMETLADVVIGCIGEITTDSTQPSRTSVPQPGQ